MRKPTDTAQFLDTQRIHNLISYLEQLHEHRRATADHTTLLLNCYAKLKDIAKLEKFIKSEGELKFDLDTAITMCRQGGYYEQAAYLAQQHGETDLVVDILVEDSKRYAEALAFIWQQDPETVSSCVYGLYGTLWVLTLCTGAPVSDEVCEGAYRELPPGSYGVIRRVLHRQVPAEGQGH